MLGFALSAASADVVRRGSLNRAGLVMDAPVRRQADVVSGVFTKISSDVTALDTAIKGFSGDISALQAASDTLIADIKSGTTTITNSQPLDINGATGIVGSVTGLNGTIATTIDDLIAIKGAIVTAGQGAKIYQSLLDQQSASKALSDATTAKAPTALQSVAAQLSQGILDSIAKGVAAYQDQQGSAPPASSAPGSSAPAESSSAAPTSGYSNSTSSSGPKTKPTTAVAVPTSAACGSPPPAPVTTSKSHGGYGGGYPTTTKAAPPAQFTGAAVAQSPLVGFALAAAGLVAVI